MYHRHRPLKKKKKKVDNENNIFVLEIFVPPLVVIFVLITALTLSHKVYEEAWLG